MHSAATESESTTILFILLAAAISKAVEYLKKILENLKATHTRNSLKVRAVIPVHLYGHPADMRSIMDVASQYDLYVVEDCAQAHGASIRDKSVGTWGHMSAFSFYPTKNLGGIGEATLS